MCIRDRWLSVMVQHCTIDIPLLLTSVGHHAIARGYSAFQVACPFSEHSNLGLTNERTAQTEEWCNFAIHSLVYTKFESTLNGQATWKAIISNQILATCTCTLISVSHMSEHKPAIWFVVPNPELHGSNSACQTLFPAWGWGLGTSRRLLWIRLLEETHPPVIR